MRQLIILLGLVWSCLANRGDQAFWLGINYYPQTGLWEEMWREYRPAAIEGDFALLPELGINAVRLFLHFETFDKEGEREVHERSLTHLLDTAKHHGVGVILTLFDWTQPYPREHWSRSQAHIERLTKRFGNHGAVIGWDLKNEPDLDYRFYPSPAVVNDWIKAMLPLLKRGAGKKLVTVGWQKGPQGNDGELRPDFISFHPYGSAADIGPLLTRHKKAGRPVVVEEFGYATVKGKPEESKQADELERAITLARDGGAWGLFLWTLHDFDPARGRTRPPAENAFGLFTAQGEGKEILRRWRKRSPRVPLQLR